MGGSHNDTGSPVSLRPLAFLFLAALALRMIPALAAVGDSEDYLMTDDPPYHVLRVARLLADTSRPTEPDPLVAHPHGAVAHWPFGFDWLLAAMVRPLVGSAPDRHVVALATSFVIPFFGALAIPSLWWIGRRFMAERAVLLGMGLLCVLPAHHDYSFFGRVDHHVVEPLIPLLALWGPLCAASATRRIAVLVSGLAAGASFAFIPAALPIAGSSVAVGGGLLLAVRPRIAWEYGASCLAATLLSLTASPHPFEWVFYSPSLLQVTGMATLAAGLGVGTASSRLGAQTFIARAIWGVLGALAFGTLAFVLLGGLRTALVEGTQYLRGKGFAVLSFEAQPLWSDPFRALTLASGLAPLTVVGVGRWLLRTSDKPWEAVSRRAAGVLAVLLVGLAVFQRRFLVAASPVLALAVGEALWWLWDLVGRTAPARRWLGHVVLVGLALVGLWPSVRHVAVAEPVSAMDRAMVHAARALARVPSTSSRGVLAPWSHGHVFQFEAGLPTVCDNFYGPPENDAALARCLQTLYEMDEAAAARRLRELVVGFVVLEPPHPEQVRAEAALIGLDPDRLVAPDAAFRPEFTRTLWGRLGLFAQRARPGERGPAGTRFLGRIREVQTETSEVEAEVLLFTVDPVQGP